jgi:hypothetical protein
MRTNNTVRFTLSNSGKSLSLCLHENIVRRWQKALALPMDQLPRITWRLEGRTAIFTVGSSGDRAVSWPSKAAKSVMFSCANVPREFANWPVHGKLTFKGYPELDQNNEFRVELPEALPAPTPRRSGVKKTSSAHTASATSPASAVAIGIPDNASLSTLKVWVNEAIAELRNRGVLATVTQAEPGADIAISISL